MSKFACSRCGRCCKETFYRSQEHLFGMYLDPSEIGNFPAEVVFPLFGRGKPVVATAYQLGVNRCPHYREEAGLGGCGIYDSRPLSCRAFPVFGHLLVSAHCPVVREAKDGVDRDSLGPELEAHRKKVEFMMSRQENEWVWPLNRREWLPIGARVTEERIS
jgi:Fe-S-cluster containining protein